MRLDELTARSCCGWITIGCAALAAGVGLAQWAASDPKLAQSATTASARQTSAAAILLPPLPLEDSVLARLAARLDVDFDYHSSPHFVVAFQNPCAATAPLLELLEGVYTAHARFYDDLGILPRRPSGKLVVLHLATAQGFAAAVRRLGIVTDGSMGFYDEDLNCALLFDLQTHPTIVELRAELARTAPPRQQELERRLTSRQAELTRTIIQHEAAHQVQANTLGLRRRLSPGWLLEGGALLFEAPLPHSGDSSLPINTYRLHEFGRLYDAPQKLPDLCHFLTEEEAWCGPECYPLAWALTYYLWCEHPTRLARLLQSSPPVAQARGDNTLQQELRTFCDAALLDVFWERTQDWRRESRTPADASVQTKGRSP